jgi:glycerol-3-phosphate acyltransferase PlsY
MMTVWIILFVAGYLLGSVPASYLVGKAHGVDLRRQGTHQVGGGNLWRTTSRKLGLIVGIFDFLKGAFMIWMAQIQGLDTGQQMVVGLAVIIGHNWPVFLKFHGGRGIATLMGIVVILPIINNISPWPSIITYGAVIIVTLIFRSSPLPVLLGAASLPLTSWLFGEGHAVVAAFLVIFLIIAAKRLMAQPSAEAAAVSKTRLYFNRLLFDRDIADKAAWLHRQPIKPQEIQEILEDYIDKDEMRDSS